MARSLVLCLVTISTITMASSVFRNQEQGEKLIASQTKFAFDLYKQLSKATSDNVFFSPASISIAMGMTYLGTKNNTSSEMKEVMSFKDVADEHLHQSFADLHGALHSPNGKYTLHTANRLYAEQNYNFLPEFIEQTKTHYKAELAQVDFRSNFEKVRGDINKWVEDQTNQKIKDLLASGTLNPLTVMVLVNAIYFKGDWAKKFNVSKTKDADFHVTGSENVTVPMMSMRGKKFNVGRSSNRDESGVKCKIIELPYVDKQLSFFIILPLTKGDLDDTINKLTLNHLLNPEKAFYMRQMETSLLIPRFKLEQSFSLKDTLSDMGMKDLFTEGRADLSGMDGSNSLFVSQVLHKAFIDVNEEGSEAAAATAGVIMLSSMPMVEEFHADHPFLFFIRENTSRSILFLGRYSNPTDGKVSQQQQPREEL